jgi:hypothetical protein
VKKFIRSCDGCVQTKNLCHRPQGLIQPLPMPTSLVSSISMDFITDLPPFSSYDSIMVVVDHLTKMAHFIMCTKTITGKRITKLFLDHVFGIMVFLKISFLIMGLNLHSSFGSDFLSF